MATIKQIAERLGISVSTVSKGLNGAPDISEELRSKVLETAVELGYTKKGSVKKSTRKLVIFIENMNYETEDDFGYDIILGFRQAAFKENWNVDAVPITHEMQKKQGYDTYMMSHGYSGAFFCGFALDDPWMQDFVTTTVPTILLDNYIKINPMVGSVGTDSDEGIEMAINHLVELGHEKIAFLNGFSDSTISNMRMTAYQNSMKLHHLQIRPDLIGQGYYIPETATAYVKQFIAHGATAILCGNDLIAQGALEECAKYGFSVPDDISVIGYDDMPFAARTTPPLTSVRQDRGKLGKCGYYVLYAMINGVSLSRNLMRPQLIVRSSTGIAKPRLVSASVRSNQSPQFGLYN